MWWPSRASGRAVVRLGRRQRVGAVHGPLELRGAQLDHAGRRQHVEELVGHGFPVGPVGRRHVALVAEVLRVVPLAPRADEARLHHVDHVAVRPQVRRQLVQVCQHTVLRRVRAVGGRGVGEPQDHLQAGGPHGVELLLELCQRGLAERTVLELREVEHAHHQRDGLVVTVVLKRGKGEVVLVAVTRVVVQTSFRVGDVGRGLRVVNGGRGGLHGLRADERQAHGDGENGQFHRVSSPSRCVRIIPTRNRGRCSRARSPPTRDRIGTAFPVY